MKKIVYLTVFLTVFLFTDSYGQGVISRPAKSNTIIKKPENARPNVRFSEPDGYINGHGYVDLGLPSGTKWATCNVGASSPQQYGNFYAWGETTPKSNYDWSNCFDCLDSTGDSWDIYKIGGKTHISPASGHDTARENWGGSWCLPTEAQYQELSDKCTWKWTTINGKKGYKVTGPNKKSIFFPAGGYRYGAESDAVGLGGYYWSSTLSRAYSSHARALYIGDIGHYTRNGNRINGFNVRPVTE